MYRRLVSTFFLLVGSYIIVASCNPYPTSTSYPDNQIDKKLNVVATTTIVGDIVQNVGGDTINLSVLLPVGIDPHSFQPSPKDMARAADADLIIINGAGLEEFLTSLLENSGGNAIVVDSSQGIDLLKAPEGESSEETAVGDPHVWMDPNNVMIWVRNILTALEEEDPANSAIYHKNAETYLKELEKLDAWVQEQVGLLPGDHRKLVTDHQVLGYFAARYGFQQVGALIPSYSTGAEPSAQELAHLEDSIQELGVKAIFVGNTINPALAERVADDTGTQLIYILTGSLTAKEGPAEDYLSYIHHNVSAIVGALK